MLDNRDCRFAPHVTVARVGDTIVALNSDPVLHTTHYYGPLQSNVALPRAGMAVARVLRRPGVVTVLCDVHGWMKAYVRVDEHRLHAVTDADGSFRITGVPAGHRVIELWHERLGTRTVDVDIEAGTTTHIEVTFEPPSDEDDPLPEEGRRGR